MQSQNRKMAVEVQLDALPYYDHGYDDPGVREAAMALVEEETRRYRPTKNYLEFLPPPKTTFESPLLKNEFERLASRQPMEMLSMKRYELPQPSSAQKNDIGAWQESVENSMAQLEHQANRILNLELLSNYSCNEWKLHNETLAQLVERYQKQLRGIRSQIQETNWLRKTEQTNAGNQLQALSSHWDHLTHKNFELERLCMDLRSEIEVLQHQAKLRGIKLDDDDA